MAHIPISIASSGAKCLSIPMISQHEIPFFYVFLFHGVQRETRPAAQEYENHKRLTNEEGGEETPKRGEKTQEDT